MVLISYMCALMNNEYFLPRVINESFHFMEVLAKPATLFKVQHSFMFGLVVHDLHNTGL